MASFAKKGKREERKKKTKTVEESRGNNIENNNVDAKKRNLRASWGIERGGENNIDIKTWEQQKGWDRCRNPYEEFFTHFERKEGGSKGDNAAEDDNDYNENDGEDEE